MKRGFTIYNENEGISTDQSKPKERPVGIGWLDDEKRVAFADANIQVADESKPPKRIKRVNFSSLNPQICEFDINDRVVGVLE